MPDNWQVQHHAVSTSSTHDLEEAVWYLKIQDQDNQDELDGHMSPYPDRPGEPDCIYYLRTGSCGYGGNCRFNHPPNQRQPVQFRGVPPERVGQPDCQYFLKTGTCKFGATCKYHHPRDKHESGQVPLNFLGLPMRQEEKSCPYYMRTGSCKFGVACKFHHPQPSGVEAMFPAGGASIYGSTCLSAPPLGPPFIGGLLTWTSPRASYLSGPRMQAPPAYMPVILSPPSMISTPHGWSTYLSALNHISPTDGSNLHNLKNSPDPASTFPQNLPERPDQPECQYYMKTGSCKFGSTCKYHHPKERIVVVSPVGTGILSPLGLPLRPVIPDLLNFFYENLACENFRKNAPVLGGRTARICKILLCPVDAAGISEHATTVMQGQAICTFYSMYGVCKFGLACKFDHPLTGYYQTMPAPSITEPRNSPNLCLSSETSPPEVSGLSGGDLRTTPESMTTRQQTSETKEFGDKPQGTTSMSDTAPSFSESQHDPSD